MRRWIWAIGYFCVFLILSSCNDGNRKTFQLIKAEKSGLAFNNEIIESDSFNIISDQYMYNGGGVGIGDFNNDGLQDIYFTGNAVSNKLFLNLGDFNFKDITDISKTGAENIWSSGVAVVDINNDGWQDIYAGATFRKKASQRKNKLFINEGLNEEGIPKFSEQAAAYGIDDDGHSSNALFFDYDLDGDLDLYVLTNVLQLKRTTSIKASIKDGSSETTDRLYRNNGNGTFANISKEAGILIEGFGLGIAIIDINKDDWPDLFISNDFVTEDILYVNNQDGTFTDRLDDYIKHGSYSSMGVDAGDINSDGHLDLMTLDMLPASNQRIKQMVGGNNYVFYDMMQRNGYEVQHVRNCLQINNDGKGFSDISQITGMDKTDWSWSVLFADYDNDGLKDIFITNGFPRDITDMDFSDFRSGYEGRFTRFEKLIEFLPEVKIRNYVYQNQGNLEFEDVSEKWGINIPSFSNGAAFADLDNDGDLDYVINNINDNAFLYKNNSTGNNSIQFKLNGPPNNKGGFGSKLWLTTENTTEYVEFSPYRGYISTVDSRLHFGLADKATVQSLKIRWPDGKTQELKNLEANKIHELNYTDAEEQSWPVEQSNPSIFTAIDAVDLLPFEHKDQNFMDFRVQTLLPRMHSQIGPGIAIGDIDNNGLEDLVVGNADGINASAFLQQKGITFTSSFIENSEKENTGMLLFDLENDGDLDLYVANGSSEYKAKSEQLFDQLFLNNGSGEFSLSTDLLPNIPILSSTVNAADFDKDGDLDLFVGGRMLPQSYPLPESSVLLQNDKGRMVDVTQNLAPELKDLGMVTAALWTDYNQDDWVDLIIVGEWMPISFFKNENGKIKLDFEIEHSEGWWNSIASGDFDEDGDLDYMLGNQGLNNQLKASIDHPVKIVAKDFDSNGSVDHVIHHHNGEAYYPYHLKKDLVKQLNTMRKKFPKFKDFAIAKSEDLFTKEELEGTYNAKAHTFESTYLENTNDGKFVMHALPIEAQFAPMKGMLVDDFSGNGHLDVLAIGNEYGTEVFTGRHDASIGLLLEGDGEGNFNALSSTQNGWKVDGDGRSLAQLILGQNQRLIIAAQNNDKLKLATQSCDGLIKIPLKQSEYKAKLYTADGEFSLKEVYHGMGYLSGSTRTLLVDPKNYSKVELIDYLGNSRSINVDATTLSE